MSEATANIEVIFEEVRQIADPRERAAFLDRACHGDENLRNRILDWLRFESQEEKFFVAAEQNISSLSLETNLPVVPRILDEPVGALIGRFKVREKLGEGGCGAVYLAEQQVPLRRLVALKIIKLGMDTKSVVARFEVERQALALMDHPNIARVLDAGATETGRPFFVMELVRGIKITAHCDQNTLSLKQRLELFIQVCHAIQHAHQKGVIHRDIKPSNILVTMHDGVPVPKIIDFGIAKAIEEPLTDLTAFTSNAHLIGTPSYMSPEQAEMRGIDVDTRSDIYSLGVLLYELLSGKTPFDGAALIKSGLEQLRRTLREQEPPPPSTMLAGLTSGELSQTARRRLADPPTLLSAIGGDLDWIVMKALDKDRQRRYQTVNGLAQDVRRYLAHEPVFARPPSRYDRLQKLMRRNRLIFVAGGAVALALVVCLAISTMMFFREHEARKLADHLRAEAERGHANEMLLRREAESRNKIIQASILLRNQHFAEADRLIAEIPPDQQTFEGATVFRSLGNWHAARGEWQPAAERYARLLQANQSEELDTSSCDFQAQATLLVMVGDKAAYERLLGDMSQRYEHVSDPAVAERFLKSSLLFPGSPVTAGLEPIASYLKTYVEAMNASYPAWTAWQYSARGLFHLRKAEYAQGADCCRKCLDYVGPEGPDSPRPTAARLILAMCEFNQAQTDAALAHFNAADRIVREQFKAGVPQGDGSSSFWVGWVDALILRNEAAGLLGQKPPRLL